MLNRMKDTASKNNLPPTFNRPVVLIVMGVSGSGKSTLAQALADKLGYRYFDADDFHSEENKARMSRGEALTDELRQPWVESIRTHLVHQVNRKENCVLAFSGLRRIHRERLRIDAAEVIYVFLNGSKRLIQQRLSNRANHFMPTNLLDSQFAALELPGADENMIELAIDQSIEDITAHALQRITQRTTAL